MERRCLLLDTMKALGEQPVYDWIYPHTGPEIRTYALAHVAVPKLEELENDPARGGI
jgi:hypothetical protein